jgi:hypothetical protein
MNALGLEPLTKGVSETGATLLAIVIGFGLSWLTQRHVDKHRRRREEFDRWFSEISAAAFLSYPSLMPIESCGRITE